MKLYRQTQHSAGVKLCYIDSVERTDPFPASVLKYGQGLDEARSRCFMRQSSLCPVSSCNIVLARVVLVKDLLHRLISRDFQPVKFHSRVSASRRRHCEKCSNCWGRSKIVTSAVCVPFYNSLLSGRDDGFQWLDVFVIFFMCHALIVTNKAACLKFRRFAPALLSGTERLWSCSQFPKSTFKTPSYFCKVVVEMFTRALAL